MLRLFVIIVPLLLTVGATVLALKLPREGQYIQKATTGAIAVGLLFSGITCWQTRTSRVNTSTQATNANCEAQNKQQEQQIASLNNEIAELKAQLPGPTSKTDPSEPANSAPKRGEGATLTPASTGQAVPVGQRVFWTQDTDKQSKGAYAFVRFKTYAAIDVPGFVAICEHPCSAVAGQAGDSSQGIALVGASGGNVAAFVFRKPRPMPLGTTGYITLRSLDKGGVKVTTFRTLQPSEMPADLR